MSETKLVINFILDNSASMKGERGEKFKSALLTFDENLKKSGLDNRIEYAIVIFKGFYPAILKNYNDELNVEKLHFGGIPYAGIQNLFSRVSNLLNEGYSIYKPWTIVLLNGENYDNVENVSNILLQHLKDGKTSYFPFALTDCEFDLSLSQLRKIKSFTIIKDEMYTSMFNWILEFGKNRVLTPAGETITFNPQLFEGWTVK